MKDGWGGWAAPVCEEAFGPNTPAIEAMLDQARTLTRSQVVHLDLFERLNPDDFLWYGKPGGGTVVDRSKPIGEGTFHRWYVRSIEAAGVAYRNPHTTRHTYATAWRKRGLALDDLQILLGHASVSTTADLYVHTNVADVAERMRAIEMQETDRT